MAEEILEGQPVCSPVSGEESRETLSRQSATLHQNQFELLYTGGAIHVVEGIVCLQVLVDLDQGALRGLNAALQKGRVNLHVPRRLNPNAFRLSFFAALSQAPPTCCRYRCRISRFMLFSDGSSLTSCGFTLT